MLLQEILDLFNNPLSKEQTWAVGYTLTKSVSEFISVNFSRRKRLRLHISVDNIDVNTDGDIYVLSVDLSSRTQQLEQDLLSSIGDVLCHCLNYGLGEDKIDELDLDDDIAEFIGRMLFQERMDQDEGFDDRSITGSLSSNSLMDLRESRKPFYTLDDAMRFCEANLVRKDIKNGLKHYRNVCKALHAEASELQLFLKQVTASAREYETVSMSRLNEVDYVEQLKQWSKLWLSVMREIREDQKCKHEVRHPQHHLYELSPSQTLIQKLRTESAEYLQKEKEFMALPSNARDIVMNFLVRGAEKCSTKRRLSFDGQVSGAFTRKTSTDSRLLSNQGYTMDSENGSECSDGLSLSLEEADDLGEKPVVMEASSPRRVLHVPTPLKFENWSDDNSSVGNVESKMESSDYLEQSEHSVDSNHNTDPNQMEHFDEVNAMEVISARDCGSQPLSLAKKKLCISASCLTEIDIEDGLENNTKRGASFLEICKTRQEITRAETETMGSCDTRLKDIKYGRICFGCKKTKFGFLRKSRVCEICRKKFCSSCILLNIELPRHLVNFTTTTGTRSNLNLMGSKNLSLSLGNLSYSGNTITPYPCRGQSVYDIGWKKTAAGPQLHLCQDCKRFVDCIMTETRNSRWQVRLQLDI